MSKEEKKIQENRDKREIAISVKGLSKTFQLPHQKIDSVRSAFVNLFAKKTYEEFDALKDVSFDVYKGEFIGVLGHNGSGKSTLLKCLAGVYTPDEGKVQVNGRISPFLELGIGFNPELSGRDNIYLNATILGLSKKEIDQKFDEIVAFSEIGRFIDQQVKNYSSGMRSRLAFAVSVHANREILLMDEVLAVGDARFKDKCMEYFKSYKEQDKTVVLVTHSMSIVREHCDRAILLHEGNVIESGDPDEVADHYIEVNLTEDQRQAIAKEEESQRMEEKRKEALEIERKKKAQEEMEKKLKQERERKKNALKPKEAEMISVTGKASIDCVKFLDIETDQAKMTFKSYDDIKVRVYFSEVNKLNIFNYGVALFNASGVYICGVNTIVDKLDTDRSLQRGFFDIIYESGQLKENSYYVSVGVFGKHDGIKHDFMEKSDMFAIEGGDQHGIVNIGYTWK